MSDDLTHIKDIGLTREKWLNTHGIHTYTDLAQVNAEWLYEQFKQEGKLVPLTMIQSWIKAAEQRQSNTSENVVPFLRPNVIPITEDGWEEFASFYISYQHKRSFKNNAIRTQVVRYRTYADHIEADENKQWDGIEGEQLCSWIMGHVSNIVDDIEKQAELTTSVLTDQDGRLSQRGELGIERVHVRDNAGGSAYGTAGGSFHGTVHSGQLLAFEFLLRFLLPSHYNHNHSTTNCTLTLYIQDLLDKRPVVQPIRSFSQLPHTNEAHYPIALQPVMLPSGLYGIKAIALTEGPSTLIAAIEIPLLQVL